MFSASYCSSTLNNAFVRYGCQFCCNSFACIIVLLTQPMPGTILAKQTQVQLVSASELDVACYLVLYQWASRPLFQAMRFQSFLLAEQVSSSHIYFTSSDSTAASKCSPCMAYFHRSLNMLPGASKSSPSHDLLWVETLLSYVLSFLGFIPGLLHAVPDALTCLTALFEKKLPLISSGDQFAREATDLVRSARLSSAR